MKRRLSRAEAGRLVSEFEQSGLRRKEFCEAHGLNVFTLDAWRKRIAQSKTEKKIVLVEIVEDDANIGAAEETGTGCYKSLFRGSGVSGSCQVTGIYRTPATCRYRSW